MYNKLYMLEAEKQLETTNLKLWEHRKNNLRKKDDPEMKNEYFYLKIRKLNNVFKVLRVIIRVFLAILQLRIRM